MIVVTEAMIAGSPLENFLDFSLCRGEEMCDDESRSTAISRFIRPMIHLLDNSGEAIYASESHRLSSVRKGAPCSLGYV